MAPELTHSKADEITRGFEAIAGGFDDPLQISVLGEKLKNAGVTTYRDHEPLRSKAGKLYALRITLLPPGSDKEQTIEVQANAVPKFLKEWGAEYAILFEGWKLGAPESAPPPSSLPEAKEAPKEEKIVAELPLRNRGETPIGTHRLSTREDFQNLFQKIKGSKGSSEKVFDINNQGQRLSVGELEVEVKKALNGISDGYPEEKQPDFYWRRTENGIGIWQQDQGEVSTLIAEIRAKAPRPKAEVSEPISPTVQETPPSEPEPTPTEAPENEYAKDRVFYNGYDWDLFRRQLKSQGVRYLNFGTREAPEIVDVDDSTELIDENGRRSQVNTAQQLIDQKINEIYELGARDGVELDGAILEDWIRGYDYGKHRKAFAIDVMAVSEARGPGMVELLPAGRESLVFREATSEEYKAFHKKQRDIEEQTRARAHRTEQEERELRVSSKTLYDHLKAGNKELVETFTKVEDITSSHVKSRVQAVLKGLFEPRLRQLVDRKEEGLDQIEATLQAFAEIKAKIETNNQLLVPKSLEFWGFELAVRKELGNSKTVDLNSEMKKLALPELRNLTKEVIETAAKEQTKLILTAGIEARIRALLRTELGTQPKSGDRIQIIGKAFSRLVGREKPTRGLDGEFIKLVIELTDIPDKIGHLDDELERLKDLRAIDEQLPNFEGQLVPINEAKDQLDGKEGQVKGMRVQLLEFAKDYGLGRKYRSVEDLSWFYTGNDGTLHEYPVSRFGDLIGSIRAVLSDREGKKADKKTKWTTLQLRDLLSYLVKEEGGKEVPGATLEVERASRKPVEISQAVIDYDIRQAVAAFDVPDYQKLNTRQRQDFVSDVLTRAFNRTNAAIQEFASKLDGVMDSIDRDEAGDLVLKAIDEQIEAIESVKLLWASVDAKVAQVGARKIDWEASPGYMPKDKFLEEMLKLFAGDQAEQNIEEWIKKGKAFDPVKKAFGVVRS